MALQKSRLRRGSGERSLHPKPLLCAHQESGTLAWLGTFLVRCVCLFFRHGKHESWSLTLAVFQFQRRLNKEIISRMAKVTYKSWTHPDYPLVRASLVCAVLICWPSQCYACSWPLSTSPHLGSVHQEHFLQQSPTEWQIHLRLRSYSTASVHLGHSFQQVLAKRLCGDLP